MDFPRLDGHLKACASKPRKDGVSHAENQTCLPRGVPPRGRRDGPRWPLSGRSVRDVAESLGVSQQSLRKWVKQTELDGRERDDGLRSEERDELRRLRRENARLKQERDLLKRAAAFFAKETETR